MTIHVHPVGDLIEHELLSDACVCGPTVHLEDGAECVVVHHSLDGRELGEPDYEPPEE